MSAELTVMDQTSLQPMAANSLEALIVRGMNDPSFDIEKLERLVALMERREEQGRKERFHEALARVQSQVTPVEQNGMMARGAGGNIPYAKREDIRAMVRPLYLAEGFSVTWDAPTSDETGTIHVQGRFTCHGHTEIRQWSCKPDPSGGKSNPQAVSSTVAYGKRQIEKMFWDVEEKGLDKNGQTDPATVTPISQDQADTIRQRMNDLPQQRPGGLLQKLCEKYGVTKPEELMESQHANALKDVESTEKARAAK